MLIDDCLPTRPVSGRRLAAALLGSLLLLAGCSGGSSAGSYAVPGDTRDGPNRGPLPTIEGGVELPAVDPAAVLVGRALAFGRPLPSEEAAAAALTEDPEVVSVVVRRVYGVVTARLVARVMVLSLDGPEIFDEGVLDGFVRGVVGASGGGPVEEVMVGSRSTLRSVGEAMAARGFRDGDLLVVVTAPDAADAALVVERQIAARAAGAPGSLEPQTPMLPLPIGAPFVEVPTVTFEPVPPPEEEPLPSVPALAGATAVEGRYGVVGGERRTIVWSFTVDAATYPWAEGLESAMAALVSTRAGGSGVLPTEVIDRVVLAADAAPGVEGALSARVFRHGALVLLVEGSDPLQVDAVVADWISALEA